ncbi:MAG: NAD(+)/NADH kinase [Nanoarchaeota archaeon]|nr:NAD(+)/NADH kinase [Nanoarchaeota archaeon]MBU4493615.1 NAD(+)/NADH kinase [Nanoarchaeota archaeon]
MLNILIVYTKNDKAIDVVKNSLRKRDIKFKCIERSRLNKSAFRNKNLIIAVGGDGTFLRASHFVKNELLLGVNSDPKTKEGFFMSSCKNDFDKKLELFLNHKFFVEKHTRLKSKINKKEICLALNEVFIGNKIPYKTSLYKIFFNNKTEEQKSSGIIVSTGAGSNAWLRSAGVKPFSSCSKKFYFIVREPYKGKLTKPLLTKGFIGQNQVLKIKSKMDNGIVAVDSNKEYRFNKGSVIEITLSKSPVRLVRFK